MTERLYFNQIVNSNNKISRSNLISRLVSYKNFPKLNIEMEERSNITNTNRELNENSENSPYEQSAVDYQHLGMKQLKKNSV